MDTGNTSFCSRTSSCSSSSSGSGDDGWLRGSRLILGANLRCELCDEAACLYCAADEARLCRECDTHIHSANFLVARHLRTPICAVCGALISSALHLPSPLPGLQFCHSCTDSRKSQQMVANRLDSEEESKVYCSEESSAGDVQFAGYTVFKRCPSAGVVRKRFYTEGVGDSEEDEYTHVDFAGSPHTASSSHCKVTARYKRRKLTGGVQAVELASSAFTYNVPDPVHVLTGL